jgi:UDP-N-acetylmuramate--alanine ligase
VDELVILPVWAAGEPVRFIDFEKEFAQYHPRFAQGITPSHNGVSLRGEDQYLEEGLVIGFGAGDITYQLRGIH